MNDKYKVYVVCDKTLKEVQDIVLRAGALVYNKATVYEAIVDRSGMSEEQRRIQTNNSWHTNSHIDLRVGEDTLYDMLRSTAYKEIFNGCRENLEAKLKTSVMNTRVRVIARFFNDGDYLRINSEIEIGDDRKDSYRYEEDINEFESKLKEVAYENIYGADRGKRVLLEKYSVGAYGYVFENFDKTVDKLIKRLIRKEFTYCIAKNKIIIPEEYIAKGKDGITEWREIKGSNNKNNSLEKKLLRQVVAEKKEFMYIAMNQIVDKVAATRRDWSIPTLAVEGNYNQGKIRKLSNQIIDIKDRQALLDMDKKDVVKKFKEYWKQELMNAYEAIDKMEVVDKN